MGTLDGLEARIRSLIEEQLLNVIPGHKTEDHLAQKLASVMYSQMQTETGNENLAPNLYVIVANPANLSRWRQEPGLLNGLAHALEVAGNEAGIKFSSKPSLSTSADSSLGDNEVRVLGTFTTEETSETQGMQLDPADNIPNNGIPHNSFLILNGTQIIPIDQSVINIGRRLDNHVVIDDPRISRNHAQIRAIKDRFVVFDLNSTGGIYVNGDRINQCVLYPGDVISLAGVTLIFGQDLPATFNKEHPTIPTPSLSADRPTAIFSKEENSSE
jgi:pSer/pThr/pTyr-binding forkhead associated (FHA) protein